MQRTINEEYNNLNEKCTRRHQQVDKTIQKNGSVNWGTVLVFTGIEQEEKSEKWGQLRDFPGSSDSKASAYNAGDLGSIPGSGRSPGEGNSNPLQYSCLENPMDGGTW